MLILTLTKFLVHIFILYFIAFFKLPILIYPISVIVINRVAPILKVSLLKLFACFLVLSLFLLYMYGEEWIIQEAVGAYPGEVWGAGALVFSGGHKLTVKAETEDLYRYLHCYISFYTDEGVAVAAGHSSQLMSETYEMKVDNGRWQTGQVFRDTSDGFLVQGLQRPEGSDTVRIAHPDEIALHQHALIQTSDIAIPVLIMGYYEARGDWYLLIKLTNPEQQLVEGHSGSPLYQGDMLVGVVASKVDIPFRDSSLGLAKLACNVYRASTSK